MAMTGSDMIDEVRFNIKRTSSVFSDTRILRRVNWAKDYVADLHTYEEMKKIYDGSTVAYDSGTGDGRRYGFPTRMKDIHSMTIQDGSSSVKLTYVPARQFDKVVPRPITRGTGTPSCYVDYGVNFELYALPDDEYPLVLRCSIYPADMTTSSECDLLRKDNLVVSIATVFAFNSLREVEDAAYWANTIVPPLYEASLTSDHSGEDWEPVARGFSAIGAHPMRGEWWRNPFSGRNI